MGISHEAFEKAAEEMRQSRIQLRMAHLIEKYAPEDRHEAAEFSAEIHMLVRDIYMDMQKPVTDTMKAILAYSQPRMIVPKDENQEG